MPSDPQESVHSVRESREEGASGALDSLVQTDLESLRKLTTKELRQQFRSVFGIASLSTNRTHLFRRLAWRLQADRHGLLRERTLGRAFQLTADGYARLPLPKAFERLVQQRMECNHRDRRLPPFGATLERTYQGKPLAVTVLANGFEYNEKIYGSLSAIAYRITGTRWNGFQFFGLKTEWCAEAVSA